MVQKKKLVVGSRKSDLALWQANYFKNEIEKQSDEFEVIIKKITTKGDRILDIALSKIGDKGLFTKELEAALLKGNIDLAVHSLKDLETHVPEGLKLGAVTKRHNVEDVLIARNPGTKIEDLPSGSTVATGSLRRRSQLKNLRPDINILDLRGNVPTRIQKFLDSDWDAIILARAGVERLRMDKHISSIIDKETIIPAVGQGALGIQIRENDRVVEGIMKMVHDENTFLAVTAERALLKALEGGCQVPIGAYAEVKQDDLHLSAMVGSLDGKTIFKKKIKGKKQNPEKIGKDLAQGLLKDGANKILEEIYSEH